MLWRNVSDQALRKLAAWIVVGLGVCTWLVCRLEKPDLATVLFRAGPLVGSTIWPILCGLYWKKTSAKGVAIAMVAGSAVGLWAYYEIGWYTGALVGTAVSMVVTVAVTWLAPSRFAWDRFRLTEAQLAEGAR